MTGSTIDRAGDLKIEVAGEEIMLLPERAIWWPARRSLIVADVHFGKSSVFRAHGLAVPGGSTQDNLMRLTACIARYPVARLLCLGDLTHARSGHTPQVIAKLGVFRAQHVDLKIELVRGNHDRHAGVPEILRAHVVSEPNLETPFSMCHEPQDDESEGYVLAGHVHPAIVLNMQRDRLRLPCFWGTLGNPAGIWRFYRHAYAGHDGGRALLPCAGRSRAGADCGTRRMKPGIP